MCHSEEPFGRPRTELVEVLRINSATKNLEGTNSRFRVFDEVSELCSTLHSE